MTYEMFGETLVPNYNRECDHPFLLEADSGCELCDIDWLLETGNAENLDLMAEMRREVVEDITSYATAGEPVGRHRRRRPPLPQPVHVPARPLVWPAGTRVLAPSGGRRRREGNP